MTPSKTLKLTNSYLFSFTFLLGTINLFGQSFSTPIINPWGLTSTLNGASLDLVDLDGDNDFDIMVGYGLDQVNVDILYYENTGTSSNPQFAPPLSNPFGLGMIESQSKPAFVDLDGDGDQDLIIGKKYNDIDYYENIGTPQIPQFALPVENPFGYDLGASNGDICPTFVDLDNDSDYDLFIGTFNGRFYYIENEGTPNNPQFGISQECTFQLECLGYKHVPTFTDIDNDGDQDLLIGELYGDLTYFENTGSAISPTFADPIENPFGLENIVVNPFPAFADLNNDGDIDLLVGTSDLSGNSHGEFWFFENTVTTSLKESINTISYEIYPNPVSNYLNIQSEDLLTKVEVYNALGRNVRTFERDFDQIPFGDLTAGIYFIHIYSPKGVGIKTIVRQ